MKREKSNDENICRCRFVKLEELQFKSRIAGIDEIKELIRLRLCNDTDDISV